MAVTLRCTPRRAGMQAVITIGCFILVAACGNRGDPQKVSLSALKPDLVFAGAPATITLTGSGFSSRTTVTVDGQSVPASVVNGTTMQLSLPATDLSAPGTVHVAVGGNRLPLNVAESGVVSSTHSPQVALYTVSLPEASRVAIQFGPDAQYGLETWAQPVEAGGQAKIFVAGMRANTTYHMRAQVKLADGSVALDQDHAFTTQGPPDPTLLPPLTPSPASGSPFGGVEMLNVVDTSSKRIPIVVTDTAGHVLWYYQPDEHDLEMTPSRLAPNGDIVMILEAPNTEAVHDRSASGVREVALAGDTVRELRVPQLNAILSGSGADFTLAGLSHEVLSLPNGHTVLLGETYKDFSDLTCCPGRETRLIGPALVDLDADWNVDWYWNGFDSLDPNRIVNGFKPYPPDWTHANALDYTADHDLLLSLRHQSWILKIDYADATGSGRLIWKLGYQGDFTLAGGDPSQWFYGQHMPEILSDDGHKMKLAVFDDGNYRVIDDTPGAVVQCGLGSGPDCYSRAVIYEIDQDAKTAQQIWEYRPGYYSFWGGDVNQLGNGDMEVNLSTGGPGGNAIVFEVTGDSTPQVVWSMQDGPNLYRAFRLPSLYPGVQWHAIP